MANRRNGRFEPTPKYHRHEETEWDILCAGDYIKVAGEKGDFLFNSVTVDNDTGKPLWLNLFGPRAKSARSRAPQLRSIAPDRIKVPTQRVLNNQRKARET